MTSKEAGSPAKAATLQLLMPGHEPRTVGVFLLDLETDSLHWRLLSNWQGYDPDDVELLEALDGDIYQQARQWGGGIVFERMADTLSNTLQIADERELWVLDFQSELDRFYRESVTE